MSAIFNEYETNIKLLHHSDTQTIINAINKTTQLLCENTDLSNKYPEVKTIFETIIQSDNDDILFSLTIAAGHLLKKDFSFFSVIQKLRNRNIPRINDPMAFLCSQNRMLIINNQDFKNFFFSFTDISFKDRQTMLSLDVALSSLVEINHEICFDFIAEWALKSDYKNNKCSITEVWQSLFYTRFLDQHTINIWISKLFSTDEPILHKAASEIISYFRIQPFNETSSINCAFVREYLKYESINDLIFIVRKILGYVLLAEHIFSLLFSLLEIVINNRKDEQIGIIKNVFFELIIQYPFFTKNFFESKKQENFTNKLMESFINDMVKQSDNYCNYLEQRKNLKELEPAPQSIRDINKFKSNQKEKIKEEAHNTSITALLCATQVIKYGKGTRIFFDNKYTDPSLFHEFSYSVSLSGFDIFSPVNHELTRYKFRYAKRNDP